MPNYFVSTTNCKAACDSGEPIVARFFHSATPSLCASHSLVGGFGVIIGQTQFHATIILHPLSGQPHIFAPCFVHQCILSFHTILLFSKWAKFCLVVNKQHTISGSLVIAAEIWKDSLKSFHNNSCVDLNSRSSWVSEWEEMPKFSSQQKYHHEIHMWSANFDKRK